MSTFQVTVDRVLVAAAAQRPLQGRGRLLVVPDDRALGQPREDRGDPPQLRPRLQVVEFPQGARRHEATGQAQDGVELPLARPDPGAVHGRAFPARG